MGISCTLWEETPERAEYYLANQKWQSRVDLDLRVFRMGKDSTLMHNLICPLEMRHSFPANFIVNGTPLPNYEVDEVNKDDEYYVEETAPFYIPPRKQRSYRIFSIHSLKTKFVNLALLNFGSQTAFPKRWSTMQKRRKTVFVLSASGSRSSSVSFKE